MSTPAIDSRPEASLAGNSPIMENTMGLEALRMAQLASEHPDDSVVQSELRSELRTVRYQLGSTNPGAREQTLSYLEAYASQYEGAPRGDELLQVFANQPDEGGVSNETLLNFLDWHRQNITEQQGSPALADVVTSTRRRYGQAVSQGVESGELHPTAVRIIPRLHSTHVKVGDMWQMHRPGDEGYHDPGTNQVVILEGRGNTPVERERDLVNRAEEITGHELTHLEFGNHIRSRIEREAGVEDLAASVKDGEFPPVLDPDAREGPGGYHWERKIMHTIYTKGSRFIPARLSRRALTAQSPDAPDVRLLDQERDASWGVEDVVGKVTSFAQNLEHSIMDNGTTAKEARTLALQRVDHLLNNDPRQVFGRRYRLPNAA